MILCGAEGNALGLTVAHTMTFSCLGGRFDLLPVDRPTRSDLVRLFIILQLLAINSNSNPMGLTSFFLESIRVKLGPLHIVVLLGFVGGSVQVLLKSSWPCLD